MGQDREDREGGGPQVIKDTANDAFVEEIERDQSYEDGLLHKELLILCFIMLLVLIRCHFV